MFVKIENYWLNTEQIVNLEPQGKSFRVNLSNRTFLMLNLKDYLVLIKAMKIKEQPLEPVKKKLPKEKATPPPAVFDKAKPKRTAVKEVEAKKANKEIGEGTGGGKILKPKTKLVKNKVAKPVPKKK